MSVVRAKALGARASALVLQGVGDVARSAVVLAVADALALASGRVLAANARDVGVALRDGVAAPLVARLRLSEEKLRLTLDGVRGVAALPDPLGRTLRASRLDERLSLFQVSVPLGVVACVFESRPDAAIQIASLALRSGNAVLLKGGREAEESNRVIVEVIRGVLSEHGLPVDSVQLLEGRAEVAAILEQDDLVDLVIPRGSSAFVRHVMDNTRIPVLGHAEGVCHIYVDAAADLEKAVAVCVDGKTDYPAACNAAETFLVHRDAAEVFLPRLAEALSAAGVALRASADALPHCAGLAKAAAPDDFGHEFGDLVASVALVDSVDAAVAFVNEHGSGHTDVIVTEDMAAARRFVTLVDTAGAFVNASPRFADGYRYGLGAEVGISTSKIHARGPVGLEGLTTTKWILLGDGQVARDYQGATPRPFLHEPLDASVDEAWRARDD